MSGPRNKEQVVFLIRKSELKNDSDMIEIRYTDCRKGVFMSRRRYIEKFISYWQTGLQLRKTYSDELPSVNQTHAYYSTENFSL